MAIYIIEFTSTIYGKQGTTGINTMPEHNEMGQPKYAHSLEQAMEWVKTSPAFANVEPHDLHRGRFLYQTEWKEIDRDSLYYHLNFFPDDATHTRMQFELFPLDTAFENRKAE